MQFSDAIHSAYLDFRCFRTPERAGICIYIYVSWKVESRRRGKGAHRKSAFGLCFIALKGMSFCTFRGVAPAGPQNINYSLGEINGCARGNLFAEGQDHCFSLGNSWYFGGVAEATSRKVQTDYLFKAISEAPNANFRCSPFRMSGF